MHLRQTGRERRPDGETAVSGVEIRALRADDAEAYVRLRREALELEPLAFAASLEDDRALDSDFVRRALAESLESVTFGAFRDGLIGAVGISRDRRHKAAHKTHVWGMYVRPDDRRSGLGESLLLAALDHARKLPGVLQVHLSVSEGADAARRLYLKHGFRSWGTEPRALSHGGQFVAEHHLVLLLG